MKIVKGEKIVPHLTAGTEGVAVGVRGLLAGKHVVLFSNIAHKADRARWHRNISAILGVEVEWPDVTRLRTDMAFRQVARRADIVLINPQSIDHQPGRDTVVKMCRAEGIPFVMLSHGCGGTQIIHSIHQQLGKEK